MLATSYVTNHKGGWPRRSRATVAGEEGIEPSHGGTRTHCLTAWLLPINELLASLAS